MKKLKAIWFVLKTPTEKLLIARVDSINDGESFKWNGWNFTASKNRQKLHVC